MSKQVNPADAANGIIGYYRNVVLCPITGKQTNCIYRTASGQQVIAYDQAAADEWERRRFEGQQKAEQDNAGL